MGNRPAAAEMKPSAVSAADEDTCWSTAQLSAINVSLFDDGVVQPPQAAVSCSRGTSERSCVPTARRRLRAR